MKVSRLIGKRLEKNTNLNRLPGIIGTPRKHYKKKIEKELKLCIEAIRRGSTHLKETFLKKNMFKSGKEPKSFTKNVCLVCLGLSISAMKSKVVLFSKKRTEAPPRLTMGGICLPALTEFKNLGVVFDRRLTWNAHTKYMVKRCKTRINIFVELLGVHTLLIC
jgi:hypothetical protein